MYLACKSYSIENSKPTKVCSVVTLTVDLLPYINFFFGSVAI